ncbi:MAG: TraR/DksA C4-type zinc finger protein [Candidatus Pacebacteria bacterium]|nr:TraR/DksA C4-type zinc finger protein [Candidatus Paceibacterota bacterium]
MDRDGLHDRYILEMEYKKKSATQNSYCNAIFAFERLVAGIHHLCSDCNTQIPADRRAAISEATTCIKCRQKRPIRPM